MTLKSYFSDSVEAAVSAASRDLGPEAMLLYSREAAGEARHLGSYEVVFAVPPGEGPVGSQPGADPSHALSYDSLARELTQLPGR